MFKLAFLIIMFFCTGFFTRSFGDGTITGERAAAPASADESAMKKPDANNDSFTDPRDNKTYRTVRLGGLEWMAVNLNYETKESWCYGNDNLNCANYGRLYTWDAAKSACPVGWRLPTEADWNNLEAAVGGRRTAGKVLKSRTGWNRENGTDAYGFSALPGGHRWSHGGFYHIGYSGYWWSAIEGGVMFARYRHMYYDFNNMVVNWSNLTDALSIRCLRE